ncbi:hypothetical protein V8F33_011583 [Rhypophila sp. PSN 637]
MAPQLQRSAIEAIHQLRSRTLLKRDGCPVIDGVERCTKPTIASQGTTWIIVGVIVGIIVVGAFSVLIFLHIKNKRRNEREDLEDRFQMADYGLEPPTGSSKVAQIPGSGPRKLSLDDSLGTNGRPSEAMSQTKRASGLPRGYVNPFVSPADDSASIKSIDLNPKWPSRSDSPASSQSPLPSKNP